MRKISVCFFWGVKFSTFPAEKNLCILHGHTFIMSQLIASLARLQFTGFYFFSLGLIFMGRIVSKYLSAVHY